MPIVIELQNCYSNVFILTYMFTVCIGGWGVGGGGMHPPNPHIISRDPCVQLMEDRVASYVTHYPTTTPIFRQHPGRLDRAYLEFLEEFLAFTEFFCKF